MISAIVEIFVFIYILYIFIYIYMVCWSIVMGDPTEERIWTKGPRDWAGKDKGKRMLFVLLPKAEYAVDLVRSKLFTQNSPSLGPSASLASSLVLIRNSLLGLTSQNHLFNGNSLAVQWLGLHAFTTEGLGSIPGWGTKIPQAMWRGQKNPPNSLFTIYLLMPSTYVPKLKESMWLTILPSCDPE